MEIESIRHKALRRFFETGDTRGLDGQLVERLRKMLAFINAAGSIEAVLTPPNFGAHELKGDRVGTLALTVTRNWRMTFRVDDTDSIIELDLEDYH